MPAEVLTRPGTRRDLPGDGPAPRPAVPAAPAEDRRDLVPLLDDPVAWPRAAAALLSSLGFRRVSPAGPGRDDAHLLVALRDAPTLRHFDPEVVAYYAPDGEGGDLEVIDRGSLSATSVPAARTVLWGHVHVLDRIPVENRFLTFGGQLRIATIDPTLTVLDLRSPAPIARWGGHSQDTDALATAIGAFFGRLIVPVNDVPGVEARVALESPEVLYRAFLAHALERIARARHRGVEPAALDAWIASAWSRARTDQVACEAAQRLLRSLRLDRPSS